MSTSNTEKQPMKQYLYSGNLGNTCRSVGTIWTMFTIALTLTRLRIALGTYAGPYPVHCRSTQCQSVFVDSNYCHRYVSFDNGPSLSMWVVALHAKFRSLPINTGASAISHSTEGLDYQLVTKTHCMKQGMFHYH